jgi:hypothetical protein
VTLQRGSDGQDPAGAEPAARLAEIRYHRRVADSSLLAAGTLACPLCDAPVAVPAEPLSVTEPLACPYCGHADRVRDFLSLAAPSRPTHVEVRVGARRRAAPWTTPRPAPG